MVVSVPGAYECVCGLNRFREFYYWDTYWIIKGLLLCNMTETARGMIENFALTLVPLYGMVRTYSTSRMWVAMGACGRVVT